VKPTGTSFAALALIEIAAVFDCSFIDLTGDYRPARALCG
jgi:hypothetical protein